MCPVSPMGWVGSPALHSHPVRDILGGDSAFRGGQPGTITALASTVALGTQDIYFY